MIPPIKLLFLPNLLLDKSEKQSICFSDGICAFDESIVRSRAIIEKRFKIYKTIATALSHTFFGDLSYEETPEDAWLLTGLRESIGHRFLKAKCGNNFYRY